MRRPLIPIAGVAVLVPCLLLDAYAQSTAGARYLNARTRSASPKKPGLPGSAPKLPAGVKLPRPPKLPQYSGY